ncbi:head-to-tail adaptor [Gordonia phage VanLee]|uniref:Head-to-tail adaptor n=1 Tax=Gordonia phage VanLee TaxID=2845816 RepID=A0A8F2D9L8_9CAUD|nr:head-to-tail adaptor [Gordonia phage VanLee]QWS68128.1 head-to-tail adaptor [Gordonia phage VanLee]
MRVYAETADLPGAVATALGDRAESYLTHASLSVENATIMARYDVDELGYPTGEAIVTAFRDAVVAQVEYWQAAGVSPIGGVLAQEREVTSQSAGGGSVSFGALRTAEALTEAITELCPMALAILRQAKLLGGNAVPGQI